MLLRPQIVFAPLIALAYRAPRGTNCVCAARDYSLLALSIGQFVLLRPQIAPLGFAPNSAALGIVQVNLPSALACTNFHHVWFVGRLLLRPEVAPLTTLGVAELATLALSVYS